jgi:hypothetical protein
LTQLSPQIQNEPFQSGLFPGAPLNLSSQGILSGPGAREAPEFAGRFAALLDMAAQPGVETAFVPPESAPFSPSGEADRLYGGRLPDTARPFSPDADLPPESVPVSGEADSPGPDGGAGIRPEEVAADGFVEKNAETRPAGPALKGRGAETAESAENTEDAPARAKQGREKTGAPGEGFEEIPGFGEGVPADTEPGANTGAVLAAESDVAEDTGKVSGLAGYRDGSRPARSEAPAKAENTEKPDGADSSPAVREASREGASGETDMAAAGESGAGPGPEETAGLAADRMRAARAAEPANTETAAGAGLEDAAAELAALPRQQKSLSPERPEKGGREEPGEARKGERRKDRLNLELRDFRTTPRIDRSIDGAAGAEKGDAENNGPPDHGQEQEIIVDLKSQARSQAEVGYNREIRGRISFRESLARELHENLNGDIVRHASLVLKNGGEGLIRLSLRPEHLGNVKIRLEMSENKVVGRIVVESSEALRAFEQELRSLEQAFVDSGFEGASLEMSVASGGGRGGAEGQWENGEAGPFFSERPAAQSYDAASGALEDGSGAYWLSGAEQQVNVLA